jgi:hypothetical protein
MQTFGFVALIVVAIFVAFGLFLTALAIPDIRRYMRMRQM